MFSATLCKNQCFCLYFFASMLIVDVLADMANDSGPVHTMPDKFENATLLLRIRLPSTLIRIKRKRSPEWNNLKTIPFCISVDGELFVFATFRIR